MPHKFRFNEEKDELLKATRGISFDEVIRCISSGELLADLKHISKDRSHQRVYIVKMNEYAYAVPYVFNQQNDEIFLKTAYPSRFFTKLYITKGTKK